MVGGRNRPRKAAINFSANPQSFKNEARRNEPQPAFHRGHRAPSAERTELAYMPQDNGADAGFEISRKYTMASHAAHQIPQRNSVEFQYRGSGALDGAAQNRYTMPLSSGYMTSAIPLKSGSTGLMGGGDAIGGYGYSGMLRDPPSHSYEERDKENACPRVVPLSETMAFRGTYLASLPKERLSYAYSDRVQRPYNGRVGTGEIIDDPLERSDFGSTRDGSQKCAYIELSSSEKIAQGFLPSENVYKKVQLTDRGDARETLGSSFMVLSRDRADREDITHETFSDRGFRHQRRSLRRDASMDYRDTDSVYGSESLYNAYRIKSSEDYEFEPSDNRYALTRDPGPMSYSGSPRNSLMGDRCMDIYQNDVNPSRDITHRVDMDTYDPSCERMSRGNYVDSVNQFKSRNRVLDDGSSFKPMQSPCGSDDMLLNEDTVELPLPKKVARGRPRQRMSARRLSRSDDSLPSGGSLEHSEDGERMSVKRRLTPALPKLSGSVPSGKTEGFFKPYKKSRKRCPGDQNTILVTQHEEVSDAGRISPRSDAPEDSEEFKRQVYKAFLKFSKVLNESSHQQKRYLEQGKAGRLLCSVCGSLSKEFVDTHSLVSHTYSSVKVGLRAQHLGLHKALCFLMGWNWLIRPDNKLYQSSPVAEANSLKEDLILWPPVVIIHNSSISHRINTNGAKVLSVEGMEEILREMGFGAGQTQVRPGRPANQSAFLVKFLPTLSGLQEAERLQKYYADNHRGRREFQHITSDSLASSHSKEIGGEVDPPTLSGLQEAERLQKYHADNHRGWREFQHITSDSLASSHSKEIGGEVEKVQEFQHIISDSLASSDSKEIGGEVEVEKVKELLYGYMAVVEDLDRLDQETKKRCLVRSKKDFEAIADAPLNTDRKSDQETKKRCLVRSKKDFEATADAPLNTDTKSDQAQKDFEAIADAPLDTDTKSDQKTKKRYLVRSEKDFEAIADAPVDTYTKSDQETNKRCLVRSKNDFEATDDAPVDTDTKSDEETKKRCLVRSKNNFEAIADAPLNAETKSGHETKKRCLVRSKKDFEVIADSPLNTDTKAGHETKKRCLVRSEKDFEAIAEAPLNTDTKSDQETKKRCLVRSEKDFEAIADAPLNTDTKSDQETKKRCIVRSQKDFKPIADVPPNTDTKSDQETKKRCPVRSKKDFEAIADAPLITDTKLDQKTKKRCLVRSKGF